ncbi:MAG: type II toxin-antitoxin system VapC family toxin [Proteobacteria bacterium]|nr:type II toxin-antitoxin system VapC family toxin [Pseudomonadota bacterium]
MRYMLDTNACITLIKEKPGAMQSRLQDLSTDEVGISSIVAAELWYGIALSQKKKINEAALRDFLNYVSVLDWPYGACPIYGRIRATLKEKGAPIGAMDLLIASHALFLNATVVTDNTSEFQRVPGLKIENWLKK